MFSISNKPTATLLSMLPALAILAFPTFVPQAAADIIKGLPAYVACKRTPVHPAPDALTKPVGMANYGQRGIVLALDGLYVLPETQQPIKKNTTDDREQEKLKLFGPAKQPTWALIEIGPQQKGYIAISCLAEERIFNREKIGTPNPQSAGAISANRGFSEKENGDLVAMRGATGAARASCSQAAVANSGRGFSEKESGDQVANRGSTGTAKLSDCANFKAIDEQLAADVQYDPYDAYESFRKEGNIGEFNK